MGEKNIEQHMDDDFLKPLSVLGEMTKVFEKSKEEVRGDRHSDVIIPYSEDILLSMGLEI